MHQLHRTWSIGLEYWTYSIAFAHACTLMDAFIYERTSTCVCVTSLTLGDGVVEYAGRSEQADCEQGHP